MRAESWSGAFLLAFGFVAGAASVSWLVLTDPEVRTMFRAKSNRMTGAGWQGIAKEFARQTVFELRESFPKWAREMTD